MKKTYVLTHTEIFTLCDKVITEIVTLYGTREKVTISAVPRGGIPALYAVAARAPLQGLQLSILEYPDNASVIIDDILVTGATRDSYKKNHGNSLFVTLVDKEKDFSDLQPIFPWEVSSGGEYALDNDIPLRLIEFIGEDCLREGLKETPKRFLNAWKYYTSGYDKKAAVILKQFKDGAENYNQMVLIKDIPIFSHCEHHLAPFYGVAHIAYIPNGKIVGLSKLARLAQMFMRRLQVQERLTRQIADAITEHLSPLGVAVVLECQHTCMIARGVGVQGTTTVTSSMQGCFFEENSTRAEFMNLINK